MKAFIDIHQKLPHYVFLPRENRIYKVRNLAEFLILKNIKEVYVEDVQHPELAELFNKGIRIFHLRIKNHNLWRKKYRLKKTHENDAKLLFLIYKDHPEYFREASVEHLRDLDIILYEKIKKFVVELKTLRHLYNNNNEELEELMKLMNKMKKRLYKRIVNKYSSKYLSKFPNIKGLKGISLIMLLQHLQGRRFNSLNHFLKYVGIKSKSNYNRRAKALLFNIAVKVKLHNGLSWSTGKMMRYIARLIYYTYTFQNAEEKEGEVESRPVTYSLQLLITGVSR